MITLLSLLLGCGWGEAPSSADLAWQPVPSGHRPAPTLVLDSPAGVLLGEITTVAVSGAAAGETVYVAAGRRGIGSGPCYAVLGGACLDVGGRVDIAGSAVADAAGDATVEVTVAADVTVGRVLGFQAVVPRGVGGVDTLLSAPRQAIATVPYDTADTGLACVDVELGSGGVFDTAGPVADRLTVLDDRFASYAILHFDQHHATIAWRPDGTLFVAFDEDTEDVGAHIKGTTFDPDGRVIESDFLVAFTGDYSPGRPDVATDGTDFYVAYNASFDEVWIARFDQEGNVIARFGPVNRVRPTEGLQGAPDIAVQSDGRVALAYMFTDTSERPAGRYYYRLFDADLVPLSEERLFATSYEEPSPPDVTATPDGGFAVVWSERNFACEEERDYHGRIRLKRLDALGASIGLPTRVDAGGMPFAPSRPTIAADPSGAGFVVGWRSQTEGREGHGAHLRALDAEGVPLGPPIVLGTAPESANRPVVGILEGVVSVVWEEEDLVTGTDVYLATYDHSTMARLTDPVLVHDEDLYDQERASLEMRAGPGGIETMVSWEHNDNPAPDYRDILMRIYEAP